MKTNIELTNLEHQMLNQFLEKEGFSSLSATEEEMKALSSVIDKANKLMNETNAYDDMGDNLMVWFYNQIHPTPYPIDDSSEVKILID